MHDDGCICTGSEGITPQSILSSVARELSNESHHSVHSTSTVAKESASHPPTVAVPVVSPPADRKSVSPFPEETVDSSQSQAVEDAMMESSIMDEPFETLGTVNRRLSEHVDEMFKLRATISALRGKLKAMKAKADLLAGKKSPTPQSATHHHQ